MDIKRVELKRLPPREPLDSLAALVRDFLWRFPRERRDTVVTLCQQARTLKEAIWLATDSIKADGKHHNHQVKVRKECRNQLAENLIGVINDIKVYSSNDRHGFHFLWMCVKRNAPWGIGPLTVYDVAVRVGAYLAIEPQRLYLHTGARAGLIALADAMGDIEPSYIHLYKKAEWLAPARLPARFHAVMTMDETEDFLCTYRSMYSDLTDFGL